MTSWKLAVLSHGMMSLALNPYPTGYVFPLPFGRRLSLFPTSHTHTPNGSPCGRLAGKILSGEDMGLPRFT
jgi:hypothetical protein